MNFGIKLLLLTISGACLVCLLVGLYGKGWVVYDLPTHPEGQEFETILEFRFGVINVTVCTRIVGSNTTCAQEPVGHVEVALLRAFRDICIEIAPGSAPDTICNAAITFDLDSLTTRSPVFEHFAPLYNLMVSAVVFNGLGMLLLVMFLLPPITSIIVKGLFIGGAILLHLVSVILAYTAVGMEGTHNTDMVNNGDPLFTEIPTRHLEDLIKVHVLITEGNITWHTIWAFPVVGIGAGVNLILSAIMVYLLVDVIRTSRYSKMEQRHKRPV